MRSIPQSATASQSVRGTRIMVRNILGMLAGGYTVDPVLAAYHDLTRDDVTAALEYVPR